MIEESELPDPINLRELANWYRSFAERAANPCVWEARLLTAEDLDKEADRVEETTLARRSSM
jgi:hypothetical protein